MLNERFGNAGRSGIPIAAPPGTVWAALIDPVRARLWRMSAFETDWQPGSPIRITPQT